MIDPINLIKMDDLSDNQGKTFHIGELPEYEQEDYNLSSPKDFEKYVKDVKASVRGSYEYKELIKYLKNFGGMDRSGLNPNVGYSENGKVKIEVHHTPMTLEDIVKVVYEKRLAFHQDLSVEMVAKEVMEDHYKALVGLYPLTATEHELVHNGYLFIPPENVFGDYKRFRNIYQGYFDEDDLKTLESIEEHSVDFDTKEQNKLLEQSNIYLDPNGAYEVPLLESVRESASNRIDTIKNNMYMLPVLSEEQKSQKPIMKQAMYYIDEKGNITDEPA